MRFLEDSELSIAMAAELGQLTFSAPWAIEALPGASDSVPDPQRSGSETRRRHIRGDEADVVAPGQA